MKWNTPFVRSAKEQALCFSEFQDGGGYWRDFGYGIMAGYKKDIVTAGGYNTNIKAIYSRLRPLYNFDQ